MAIRIFSCRFTATVADNDREPVVAIEELKAVLLRTVTIDLEGSDEELLLPDGSFLASVSIDFNRIEEET